ncbi:MAG: TetR/AcrR family transcriptional regulator [Lysobacteraceae bacterium]|nr:MAG: TetR/AcrR family transcriptional regulator [Xanthomonadaceae bacterium]
MPPPTRPDRKKPPRADRGAEKDPCRRAVGRPAGEQADLRDRLLDASVACFARKGIAATSLREIAAEVGATPALLHYYFGGKDALQAAVIEERVMPLFGRLHKPLQHALDQPRDLVHAIVRTVIATAMANPWLPQLWVREVLQEDGVLRSLMLERIGPLLPRLLSARLRADQAAGLLNPRLDPRLLVPSIIGQTMFLVAAAPIWRRLFDADDIDAEALTRHALTMLESGMELRDD